MMHASYSYENSHIPAILGLTTMQSTAALRALSADHDASASAISCPGRPPAPPLRPVSASPRSCVLPPGPNRCDTHPLIGTVAVEANSTHPTEKVFCKLHVLNDASTKGAM
uniref:Uncharacterized protein n=1 Tax=Oryza punctata TaxID=4537 RepID=A0A0E0JZL4_ORYPU